MKKLFLMIAALAIVFANVDVKAQCPTGIDCQYSDEDFVVYDGCVYRYTYCLCINEFGLHEVVLTDIQIQPPCDPGDFQQNPTEITDAILLDIAASGILEVVWGEKIPECPDDLCIVRWRDAICYTNWFLSPPDPPTQPRAMWKMNKCIDNRTRSCGETIRICWEVINGVRQLTIWRQGYQTIPCPPNCRSNCD